MCVTLKRNSKYGHFSQNNLNKVSHKVTKKMIYYLLSKIPANNTVPMFSSEIQFRRKNSKKEVSCVSQFAFLKQNSSFCVRGKSENQVQMHSTYYFLRF